MGILSLLGSTYKTILDGGNPTANRTVVFPDKSFTVADNADIPLTQIGIGQTWQTVTRTSGVTYTNSTGKPIMFYTGLVVASTTNFTVYVSINGAANITIATCTLPSGTAQGTGTIIIPTGLGLRMFRWAGSRRSGAITTSRPGGKPKSKSI